MKFKLPDFIDVVLNAGDQRNPHGATIGQSLPNWGPVADAGRAHGGDDQPLHRRGQPRRQLEEQMSSLFCKATDGLRVHRPQAGG